MGTVGSSVLRISVNLTSRFVSQLHKMCSTIINKSSLTLWAAPHLQGALQQALHKETGFTADKTSDVDQQVLNFSFLLL